MVNETVGVDPQPARPTARRSRRATAAPVAGSAVLATLAVVAGDAAMAGVAAASRALVPGPAPLAWLAAAAVIAAGSFAFVGIPQIALGRRHGELNDRRARWAVRLLDRSGGAAVFTFALASIVAGPLAVGWFAGRNGDPKARRHTASSAVVFGAVWAAVYLGAVSALS